MTCALQSLSCNDIHAAIEADAASDVNREIRVPDQGMFAPGALITYHAARAKTCK
jgi:hypothetical protein